MIQNDRLKIVNDIVNGSSIRFRESYIKNNHSDFYDMIVSLYSNLEDISFKEKMWLWVNDIFTYYTCTCGTRTKFNKNWNDGYKKYCSGKCSQSSPLTKEKRKNTVLNKYGVDNVSKSDIVKKRQEETNIVRYGTKSSFQNDEVKNKWKNTIKEKYGVDHIFKLDSIKEKSIKTSIEKYGTKHFVQSEDYKKLLQDTNFSDNLRIIHLEKHMDKYSNYGLEFVKLENRVLTLIGECGHEFTIHYDSLKRRLENNYDYCTICNPVNSGQSQDERVLIEWLKSLNIDVVEKDRSLSIELDVYIPSKSIAFEFNGLYWHSEIHKNHDYHINKTNICNQNDIRLIHIWSDDWMYRRDITKSIILNSIGLTPNKIFARKCKIVIIDNKRKNDFLDKNHIQGKCSSSINIGLLYNDEIVSMMTFGNRKINGENGFELIRFCNKINTVVVGSASKLFTFFKSNYEHKTIISYADVSHFTGDLYHNLGFTYIHRSKPNYWWVVDGVRHHRFTYNKKRLVREGSDPNQTEVQIMYGKGYYRIFGCGQDRYVLNF